MKRKDIIPGFFYLMSTSKRWDKEAYYSKRVEVIDAGHWEQRSGYSSWPPKPGSVLFALGRTHKLPHSIKQLPAPTPGSGILVRVYRQDPTTKGWAPEGYRVVRLMDIKGDWETLTAQIKESQLQREESRKRQDAERVRKNEAFQVVKARFLKYGIKVEGGGSSYFLSMTEDSTQQLLDLLDRHVDD